MDGHALETENFLQSRGPLFGVRLSLVTFPLIPPRNVCFALSRLSALLWSLHFFAEVYYNLIVSSLLPSTDTALSSQRGEYLNFPASLCVPVHELCRRWRNSYAFSFFSLQTWKEAPSGVGLIGGASSHKHHSHHREPPPPPTRSLSWGGGGIK